MLSEEEIRKGENGKRTVGFHSILRRKTCHFKAVQMSYEALVPQVNFHNLKNLPENTQFLRRNLLLV